MEQKIRLNEETVPQLPGPDLMFRVAGTPDPGWFWNSGRTSIEDINGLLSLVGKSFTDFPRALDFGCGCGRMLLHLQSVAEMIELHGVDIDADAIGWARQHVPWASFAVNQGLPPLDFPDEYFDLIFNHSVFSHLDERYQDAWLVELERITKPGGVLVLSVLGEHPFAELEKTWHDVNADPTPLRETLRTEGFLYIKDDSWANGPFPDFYHTAFHAPWYIFERWGSIFDIKAYVVRGDLDFQDQLLLRRRNQRVGRVAPLPNPASQLTLAQERVASLEVALNESRQRIAALELALDEASQRVTALQSALTRSDEEVGQWRSAAERSAGDLEKVLASRSWRLTAPLRKVMAHFRFQG